MKTYVHVPKTTHYLKTYKSTNKRLTLLFLKNTCEKQHFQSILCFYSVTIWSISQLYNSVKLIWFHFLPVYITSVWKASVSFMFREEQLLYPGSL